MEAINSQEPPAKVQKLDVLFEDKENQEWLAQAPKWIQKIFEQGFEDNFKELVDKAQESKESKLESTIDELSKKLSKLTSEIGGKKSFTSFKINPLV